jgi:hypothetical protein
MKTVKTLTLLTMCVASLALADDITTISGKVYKHATVTRVEPDGIVVKFSRGLVKIPFTELSKELQERYDYDPEAAQSFRAQNAAVINALNAGWDGKGATNKYEQQEELLLRQIRVFAFIKPDFYGREQTTAMIQECAQYWKGPTAYDFEWSKVGKPFTGVIDEPMPENYEEGDAARSRLRYRLGADMVDDGRFQCGRQVGLGRFRFWQL